MNTPNWKCPYCGHWQILSKSSLAIGRLGTYKHEFVKISEQGDVGLRVNSIACLNHDCKKLSLTIYLTDIIRSENGDVDWSAMAQLPNKSTWQLLPQSEAKIQAGYIPQPIRQDYEEACLIKNLSPKASATLARRCLQGMIHDFCGIKKRTLNQEIEVLKSKAEENQLPQGVTLESIESIDYVRELGNIGAHMDIERDVLVDIDPNEAGALIDLVEILFEEWYVARHNREKNLDRIKKIADTKKEQIQNAKNAERNSASADEGEN